MIMNGFYPKYQMKILTDILDVMTDGFHKSGLESQSKIFYILIQVAKSNIVHIYQIFRLIRRLHRIKVKVNQMGNICIIFWYRNYHKYL